VCVCVLISLFLIANTFLCGCSLLLADGCCTWLSHSGIFSRFPYLLQKVTLKKRHKHTREGNYLNDYGEAARKRASNNSMRLLIKIWQLHLIARKESIEQQLHFKVQQSLITFLRLVERGGWESLKINASAVTRVRRSSKRELISVDITRFHSNSSSLCMSLKMLMFMFLCDYDEFMRNQASMPSCFSPNTYCGHSQNNIFDKDCRTQHVRPQSSAHDVTENFKDFTHRTFRSLAR
jgi:hypothetical protein